MERGRKEGDRGRSTKCGNKHRQNSAGDVRSKVKSVFHCCTAKMLFINNASAMRCLNKEQQL